MGFCKGCEMKYVVPALVRLMGCTVLLGFFLVAYSHADDQVMVTGTCKYYDANGKCVQTINVKLKLVGVESGRPIEYCSNAACNESERRTERLS